MTTSRSTSDPTPCPITGAIREYQSGELSLVHADDDSPCYGRSGRILQIMPAAGWRYVCADEAKDGGAETTEYPLVAFALVELCDGDREVAPLTGMEYIERADQLANFLGLVGPGEAASLYQKDAAAYVAKERVPRTKAVAANPGARR